MNHCHVLIPSPSHVVACRHHHVLVLCCCPVMPSCCVGLMTGNGLKGEERVSSVHTMQAIMPSLCFSLFCWLSIMVSCLMTMNENISCCHCMLASSCVIVISLSYDVIIIEISADWSDLQSGPVFLYSKTSSRVLLVSINNSSAALWIIAVSSSCPHPIFLHVGVIMCHCYVIVLCVMLLCDVGLMTGNQLKGDSCSSFGCHVTVSNMASRLMVSWGSGDGCGLPQLAQKKIMLDSDDAQHCHHCCCITSMRWVGNGSSGSSIVDCLWA